jgi:predicted ester cyclase
MTRNPQKRKVAVMSVKGSKALVRRWFEEYNKGKAEAMTIIDELCSNNYVYHGGSSEERRDLKNFKQSESEFFNAFPDLHFIIDDMIVEGGMIATRFKMAGTHTGEFGGIPPTHKKVTVWGIEIDRVAGSQFVESWVRFDTLGFMQQLGAIPTPEK